MIQNFHILDPSFIITLGVIIIITQKGLCSETQNTLGSNGISSNIVPQHHINSVMTTNPSKTTGRTEQKMYSNVAEKPQPVKEKGTF
jgi:hypothetical protein